MSGFNAPLSVQAASLKKSVQNRERRRNARQVGSAPYRTVIGGTAIDTTASVLQAGSAWEAADVEAKALLKSGSSGIALTPESAVYDHAPQVFHCSLCQASTIQALWGPALTISASHFLLSSKASAEGLHHTPGQHADSGTTWRLV